MKRLASLQLESEIPKPIRTQGGSAYRRGKIQLSRRRSEQVRAEARESQGRPDEACIELHDGILRYTCSCAYYAPLGELCKHVWGALLLAETKKLGGFDDPPEPLRLEPCRVSSDGNLRPFFSRRRTQPAARSVREDGERAMALDDELDVIRVQGRERSGRDLFEQIPTPAESVEGPVIERFVSIGIGRFDGVVRVRLLSRHQDELGVPGPMCRGWPAEEGGPADREELRILLLTRDLPVGTESIDRTRADTRGFDAVRHGIEATISPEKVPELLPQLVRSDRALREDAEAPLRWEDLPLRVHVRLETFGPPGGCRASVLGFRGGEPVPLEAVDSVAEGGVARLGGVLCPVDPPVLCRVLRDALRLGALELTPTETRELVTRLWDMPSRADVEFPEELAPKLDPKEPVPKWVVRPREDRSLEAAPRFAYGSVDVDPLDPREEVLDSVSWTRHPRHADVEAKALSRLVEAVPKGDAAGCLKFAPGELSHLVPTVAAAEWEIHAEGRRVRTAGARRLSVQSGVDWFALEGRQDYGEGLSVGLPELLRAIEQNRSLVRLDDGSMGVVPEEWLRSHGLLLRLAREQDGELRFSQAQAVWLDRLLESGDEYHADPAFERIRAALHRGLRPAQRSSPAGLLGELRPYQEEGLGWLQFLRETGFGGILADDMGLGKTVQVLAHVLSCWREHHRPSLVVVPKSLIHHWTAEAKQFTPELGVIDYTGAQRHEHHAQIPENAIVLTTYGILRRDVKSLEELDLECLVLDEAQAVKNERTATAQAARRLNARQRLVVTGTPVENHLGELVGHLDFLNPGLFGANSGLRQRLVRGSSGPTLAAVSRAVRPLILRRTKGDVARDLPPKVEQDLVCELEGKQRRLYEELKEHFAERLLPRASDEGLGRMKIQVLDALLRLRQAACHPALIDRGHAALRTAKFDVLLPRIEELVEEGSKALVFSQFTKYLDLLRLELDQRGIPYELLTGKTLRREQHIRRFQTDPDCPLFLISLKAGGVGLNLTAAHYVFLLDPWWNPAVEAQAIDRVHRRGQTRKVIAYRLLARNTVEEKIRELQQRKRFVADALLTADNALLRRLDVDDLRALLS